MACIGRHAASTGRSVCDEPPTLTSRRHIFGDEVGDAVKVLLAQEVQAAAPEVARAAEAAALGAIAGDWLIERTYGLSDEGIKGWPEINANAYRCAIEDAQSALRERADELTDETGEQ